jgi:CheY-like chemotaxis protein
MISRPLQADHVGVSDLGGRLRLLIVDDSPEVRRLLCSLLSDHASEILECENGSDAVRRYFEMRPDWVLMDLRMEGVDGLAATREILRRDGDARVIIVSQHSGPEIREAIRDAGAVAYVHKDNLLVLRKLLS